MTGNQQRRSKRGSRRYRKKREKHDKGKPLPPLPPLPPPPPPLLPPPSARARVPLTHSHGQERHSRMPCNGLHPTFQHQRGLGAHHGSTAHVTHARTEKRNGVNLLCVCVCGLVSHRPGRRTPHPTPPHPTARRRRRRQNAASIRDERQLFPGSQNIPAPPNTHTHAHTHTRTPTPTHPPPPSRR